MNFMYYCVALCCLCWRSAGARRRPQRGARGRWPVCSFAWWWWSSSSSSLSSIGPMPPYGRWTYSGLSGQNTVQAGTFCLRHSARTDILFRTFFVLFLDYIVLFPYFVALFTCFFVLLTYFVVLFLFFFSSLFPLFPLFFAKLKYMFKKSRV